MAVRRFRPRLHWPHRRRRSGVDPAYDRLVRLWLPIAQPGGLPARRTLRALLAPEAGLTRFEGRDDERADLLRWCTDGAGAPVRVLVGPAGVGKTRLAVELARALPEEWATGIARPGTTAQIVPAAAGCRRPVLIIVDDADTEPAADIAALFEHAAAAPDRVRVLLVARIAEAIGGPEAPANGITAHPANGTTACPAADPAAPEYTTLRAAGTDDDRRQVFAEAVRAFGGLPEEAPLPAWAEPGRGPVGADGEPIGITLARAALATDDRGPALRTADLRELTEELLRDEQHRWAATAADPRWSLDGLAPDAQEEALLALLLHRPHRIDDVVATLRTLDRFRLASDEHVHDVATWAGPCTPGRSAGAGWTRNRSCCGGRCTTRRPTGTGRCCSRPWTGIRRAPAHHARRGRAPAPRGVAGWLLAVVRWIRGRGRGRRRAARIGPARPPRRGPRHLRPLGRRRRAAVPQHRRPDLGTRADRAATSRRAAPPSRRRRPHDGSTAAPPVNLRPLLPTAPRRVRRSPRGRPGRCSASR